MLVESLGTGCGPAVEDGGRERWWTVTTQIVVLNALS